MKRIFLVSFIFVFVTFSSFAHTNLYSFGVDMKYFFKKTDVASFDIFAGATRFYDKDDIKKQIVPIFDGQVGASFTSSGIGVYTQLTGGISYRPIELLIFNTSLGGRATGLWNSDFSYVIFPDVFDFDGILDTSITLNFWYFIGVKFGHTLFLGTSGAGGMPYIAITTSFK